MSFDALASGWARVLGVDRKQFNMFFERMMDGFAYHKIVLDAAGKPVDYIFLEVNSAFERLTGLKRENLVGKRVTEVMPGIEKDSADWIGVYGKVALTCEPAQFENYAAPLDRWFNVNAYCPQKGYFVTLFEDITERKKAEDQLVQSEKTFSELVERAPFGIYVVDSQFRIAQMNVGSQNGAFRNVKPVVGRDFSEAMHILWPEPTASEIISYFRHTLETGDPYYSPQFVNPRHDIGLVESYEWELHRITLPSGEFGVICYYFDSTKLREAETALRSSEENYRHLLEYAPTAIYEIDYNPPRFKSVNEAMCQLTGYTREELLAMSPMALLTPESQKRFAERTKRILAGEKIDDSVEFTTVIKGGKERQVVLYVKPLFKDGKLDGALVVGYDITERKRAEEEIRQSEERFRSVLDNSLDVIYRLNLQTGRYEYMSPSSKRLIGFEPEEIMAMSNEEVLSRVHPDDSLILQADLTRINETGKGTSEYRFLGKDGKYRWWYNQLIVVKDENGKPLYRDGFVRDVTERKQGEEALRTSNERLALVSTIISQLLSTARPQALIQELCMTVMKFLDCDVFFNFLIDEQKEKLHLNAYAGVPAETAKTFEWLNFGEAVCGCAAQDGQRILCENIPDTDDHRTALVRSFGVKAYAAHPLFSEGKVIGTVSFGSKRRSTFTEDELSLMKTVAAQVSVAMTRQNAEEGLAKQAALIDLSPDAIIVRNADGKITLWSDGAEKMYGWSKEEALGQTTHNLLKTEFPMPLNEILVQVASRGQWSGELIHTGKDGRIVYVRSHWLGRFDKNKENLLEILETNVDITERKQMQDKLEEYAKNLEGLVEERTKEANTQRERLYQVLETIPAYVVILDKDYQVPFANKVFRDLFGESNGRCCYDFLFQRDSPCELCETYKVLQTGKPHHWEWTGPNGHNYDIYDYPFKAADDSIQILEMGVDITQRKKAEEALQAEKKRFFDVLETMPQMICLLTPDYNVAFANRAFRRQFGESKGRRCYEYCFGQKEPCQFCQSYEVFKTGKPIHWEAETNDGKVIDAYDFPFTDADGSPLILEVDTDITEQKRATKRLRDASLYARSLIEASLDPLVTINAKGKITDVNEATIHATGCNRDELVGSDFSDYFTEPKNARAGYRQVFAKGYVRDYPLTLRHKSGKIMDVLYNAAVYKNDAGEILGVFAAARDVTELNKYREHLEELVTERTTQLRESQEKLELKAAEVEEYATNMEALAEERARKLKDAERLAAIGATAGMVGHDIRNPLQAITGDVYLLSSDVATMRSCALKESLTESLESIQKSVDYVNKIVQDLQDYAKPLKPAVHETDLQAILDDIVKKNGKPHNVTLKQTIAKDAQTIKTDPDMLKRILGNLISNAIQAMPNGGKLTVKAAQKRDSIVLTVRDSGTGIPEHAKANLFTPLFTTKSKGQGFGLAVVKRMTEALGGTVLFESEEGKGTQFTITLPQLNQD